MPMKVQCPLHTPSDHGTKQIQPDRNLLELLFGASLESPYDYESQHIHTALTPTTTENKSKSQGETKSQTLVENMVKCHMSSMRADGQHHSQLANSNDGKLSDQHKEIVWSTCKAIDNEKDTSYLHKQVRLFRQCLMGGSTSPQCEFGAADPGAQCAQFVPASRNKIRYAIVNKSSPRGDYSTPSATFGAIHPLEISETQPYIHNQSEVVSCAKAQLPSSTSDGQHKTQSISFLASPNDATVAFTEEDASPCHSKWEKMHVPETLAFPEAKIIASTPPWAGDNYVQHVFTTMVASFLPAFFSIEDLHRKLDVLGLRGTYDMLYFRQERLGEESMRTAYINFMCPMFALKCQNVFESHVPGSTVKPAPVQGYESNLSILNQLVATTEIDAVNIFIEPSPKENSALVPPRFSPQIRGQFHKTRMCSFYQKSRCALGTKCSFAHTKTELQPTPDLQKTKLCFNFFRHQCDDQNCRFAHGYAELRATEKVYKTELCRWSTQGWCKAGSSCRYAHTQEEIRSPSYDVEPASLLCPAGDMTTGIGNLSGKMTIEL